MAKRTPGWKGMRNRERFERVRLRLQESIPTLVPAPRKNFGPGSGSGSGCEFNVLMTPAPALIPGRMVQLRWLGLRVQIIGFWDFCTAPAPTLTRLR